MSTEPKFFEDFVRQHLRDREIDTVTLHTTEGANRPGVSDLKGLAAFFRTVQADSTWGVDQEGNACRMLRDIDQAWTNGFRDENHRSITIEQVGFAATTKKEWVAGYHNGLRSVARILAAARQDGHIKLKIFSGEGHGGVNEHVDISGPGGHHDCGPGYPRKYVVNWALHLYHKREGNAARAKMYAGRVKATQRRFGVKSPTVDYR